MEVSMAPTVLVADADTEMCDLYRRFFAYHGWQVRTSGGGFECMAQLRQFSPHLLILDLQLPWGGADGVLAVMRDEASLVVPVILTSIEASSDAPPDLLSPPVVQALWKPFSLTNLLEIMCSAMEAGHTISRRFA
jgi:DNA-binding response OmpR family regulator